MSELNPYSAPTTTLRRAAPPQNLTTLLFSFEGRIPRRVFWGVSIIAGLAVFAVVLLVSLVFGQRSVLGALILLVGYIPLIWISLALQAKRWHDRDKSGWWWLINFVPIIGGLWAFIETGCLRGTVGPNNYGVDPT